MHAEGSFAQADAAASAATANSRECGILLGMKCVSDVGDACNRRMLARPDTRCRDAIGELDEYGAFA